jgi:UDP-N-acetylglucosamine 3-dehydrogenase
MGRNHARVYGEIPTAELVAVADSDQESATRIARTNGAKAYVNHVQLLERERPDAISVTVPTNEHFRVTMDALSRGVGVLVEKPIASTVAEAELMIAEAARSGSVLAVGHIERYNPAIAELKRRLDGGQLGTPYQIHARRLGPFPQRVRDVGVVIDLATHDLDMMRYLIGDEPVQVYAGARREIHTSSEDLLTGLVRFNSGVLGLLEANWLTPTKIRELLITGERGMFRADYLTQDLFFFENGAAPATPWESLRVLRGVNEGAMIRYPILKQEPLRLELDAFLVTVGRGFPQQIVSGRDGLLALRLALALLSSCQSRDVVNPSWE